jgi:hypothetical protein
MTKAVKTMVANLARLVYRMLRHLVFSTCTFPGASLGCETRSRRVLAGPPTKSHPERSRLGSL